MKCVDEGMPSMGIKVCVAQDRCAWRHAIRGPSRACLGCQLEQQDCTVDVGATAVKC